MPRPQKQGLEYFSLDVFLDDKFHIIEAEHGAEGFTICIKLLQKIYSVGYYYPWSEMEQILFSRALSMDKSKVVSVVEDCIKWELFSKAMYEKYGILTSKGIQKRFMQAVYKRAQVELVKEFLLIPVSETKKITFIGVSDIGNADATGVSDVGNADASGVSDIQSTQSKVKESKVKESKGKKSKGKESKEDESRLKNLLIDSDESICQTRLTQEVEISVQEWNQSIMENKIYKIRPSSTRYKMLCARLKEHGLSDVLQVIHNTSNSDFLRGQNKNSWTATFEWIMRPNNFMKVLEGNYNNKQPDKNENMTNQAIKEVFDAINRNNIY